MKSLRILLSVAILSLSAMAFAQADAHKHAAQSDAPKSDAQKAFDKLKTLAGTWSGPVTVDSPPPGWDNKPIWLSMRVTSRGNLLVHEMKQPGTPDDPKQDDPVTTFYVEGDRLLLTHYCDAGNRPRMEAKVSPDGKKIEFDFVDVSGSTQHGHMYHAAFTFIDADHHTEEWTFMMPGEKLMRGHMDLQRVNQQAAISQK